MCCIFTCCAWVIDLLQRFWTFTMSCCISSAVCCSFFTASMSGVALGYNYSLAEYIDLRETNVSVYLKRGIFDDDIAGDMVWRRSGQQPGDRFIKEDNLITGGPDESTTLRSGRRLDDSIYESNDKHNFEGSLMRLTASPLDQITPPTWTAAANIHEIEKPFEVGSLDQLKAIQSVINKGKAAASSHLSTKNSEEDFINSRRRFDNLGPGIGQRLNYGIPPFEKSPPNAPPYYVNPLRLAVPDDQINQSYKWRVAKLPPEEVAKNIRYDERFTTDLLELPRPVTPRAGPVRPTKSKPRIRIGSTTTRPPPSPSRSPAPNLPKSIDEEMESFKEKPLLDTFDDLGMKEDDFVKKIKITDTKTNEDYEDDIKGVPLRKKRNIRIFGTKKLQENKIIEVHNLDRLNNEIQTNDINKFSKLVVEKNLELVQNINITKENKAPLSKTVNNLGISSKSPIMKSLLAVSVA